MLTSWRVGTTALLLALCACIVTTETGQRSQYHDEEIDSDVAEDDSDHFRSDDGREYQGGGMEAYRDVEDHGYRQLEDSGQEMDVSGIESSEDRGQLPPDSVEPATIAPPKDKTLRFRNRKTVLCPHGAVFRADCRICFCIETIAGRVTLRCDSKFKRTECADAAKGAHCDTGKLLYDYKEQCEGSCTCDKAKNITICENLPCTDTLLWFHGYYKMGNSVLNKKDINEPVTAEPGTDGPGSDGPGGDGPGSNGPGSDGPGSDGPGSDGPGSNGPGSDGPGSNGPGSAGPGSGGPRTETPGEPGGKETDGQGTEPYPGGPGEDGTITSSSDRPVKSQFHRPDKDVKDPGSAPHRTTRGQRRTTKRPNGANHDGPQPPAPASQGNDTFFKGFDIVMSMGSGKYLFKYPDGHEEKQLTVHVVPKHCKKHRHRKRRQQP